MNIGPGTGTLNTNTEPGTGNMELFKSVDFNRA